jgi:hypothetical protein
VIKSPGERTAGVTEQFVATSGEAPRWGAIEAGISGAQLIVRRRRPCSRSAARAALSKPATGGSPLGPAPGTAGMRVGMTHCIPTRRSAATVSRSGSSGTRSGRGRVGKASHSVTADRPAELEVVLQQHRQPPRDHAARSRGQRSEFSSGSVRHSGRRYGRATAEVVSAVVSNGLRRDQRLPGWMTYLSSRRSR